MSYIITMFKHERRDGRREYRFVNRFNGSVSDTDLIMEMMEWFDQTPLAAALRRNEIIYAWTPHYKSSVTVRDLTDDELMLVKLTAGTDFRIAHESELRERQPRLSPSDGYKRAVGTPKKCPNDYSIVKRRRLRR